MKHFARWIYNSHRRHGIGGSLLLLARGAHRKFRMLMPGVRRARALKQASEKEFDARHNISTRGVISLSSLEPQSDDWLHCYGYEAITEAEFHAMMTTAGNVADGRVFIDFGCGKGRAMLLAAMYPFRRVVGVEFVAELSGIASANIKHCKNFQHKCSNFDVLTQDATQFQFPQEPLVLYFYNPFMAPVMARVIENLRKSLIAHPREVTILYSTPNCQHLWLAQTWITLVESDSKSFVIFNCSQPPQPTTE